jgi:photosystem II stability/assembly factor-like uncharacterized protein
MISRVKIIICIFITCVTSWSGSLAQSNGINEVTLAPKNPQMQPILIDTGSMNSQKQADTVPAVSLNLENIRWKRSDGPTGGWISALGADSDYIVVGTEFGEVFRSLDKGRNWKPIGTRLQRNPINAFACKGTDCFAGTSNGLYHSSDKGVNWNPIKTCAFDSMGVYSLLFIGSSLYVGTQQGIYTSADSGKTWMLFYKIEYRDKMVVYSLANIGNLLSAGTGQGVLHFKGNDIASTSVGNGIAWTSLKELSVQVKNINNTMYAGTSKGVFRSRDRGMHWEEANDGLFSFIYGIMRVNNFASFDTIVFACNSNGICRFNGAAWSYVKSGCGVSQLFVFENRIFGGTQNGILLSTDAGENWNSSDSGLVATSITALAEIGASIFAGTNSAGVFRSDNGGQTWTAVNQNLNNSKINSLLTVDTALSAGTQNGLYVSRNLGKKWTLVNIQKEYFEAMYLYQKDGKMFAFNGSAIFRSPDTGRTWARVHSNLNGQIDNICISALVISDGNIIIGSRGNEDDGIYRSSDNGKTWKSAKSGLTSNYIYSLTMLGADIFAATGEGVFLSGDSAKSWNAVNMGLPTDANVIAYQATDSILFAGIADGGVYYSVTRGKQWVRLGVGLDSIQVNVFLLSGSNLIAGTSGAGVWRLPVKTEGQAKP